MRLPFLKKATQEDLHTPGHPKYDTSFKTPTYEYTPSETLQLIIHLPANGFVHLRPPRDSPSRSDTPAQYDHILNGTLEVVAPMGWSDRVESIIVGYRVACKLNRGKGREEEIESLFERHVSLEGDNTIVPGSQSLILPSTLPAHDYHNNFSNVIIHHTYADLVSSSTSPPPAAPSSRDFFSHDLRMSPTSISVTPKDNGTSHVTYSAFTRGRVAHMTESDATFVTLDHTRQGLAEGLGVYDYTLLSDVFRMNLPSLTPLTTVFSVRLFITQLPTIRSPVDPTDPPSPLTSRTITLAKFGDQPPPGHVHPAAHTKALWRGSSAGGKGTGDGWQGEVMGRLPDDKYLRASTIDGINTPIDVRHTLCVEIIFSVHGQFADGKRMNPPGPGALRVFRRKDEISLPACVNIPNILKLPTYEESSYDQGEGHCACILPAVDVAERMKAYVEGLKRGDAERAEVERQKGKLTANNETT